MTSNRSSEIPGLDLTGWFTDNEADVYRWLAASVRSGVIVEIGVWKGRSLSAILDICRANRNRVFAVDAWNPDPMDPGYAEATHVDISAVFRRNLELLGHLDTVEILREESEQAFRHFGDRSIDLLFLDADHSYDSVIADIRTWLPKMALSGVLCGHDYTTRAGVRRAVDEVFGARAALPGGSIWMVSMKCIR